MADAMHDESDYYAPPASKILSSGTESEEFDLRLFLRWERLRLFYNGVLAVFTVLCLLILPPRRAAIASLPPILAFYCFLANVCFCLGPVLDGYARWMGVRGRACTMILFGSGLLFACLLAYIAVFFLRFGPSDMD